MRMRNRGIAKSYDPDTFVRAHRSGTAANAGPLFFTVHLTLDHWPYAWAGSPLKDVRQDRALATLLPRGRPTAWTGNGRHPRSAAQEASAGECHRLRVLRSRRNVRRARSGAGHRRQSDHAGVVHSTGPPGATAPRCSPLDQYRIMLGMRRYGGSSAGAGEPFPRRFRSRTLRRRSREMLGVKSSARFDGHSLLPLIEGREGAEQNYVGTHPFHRNRVPDAGGIRHAGRRDRFRKDAGGNAGLQHRSRHRSSHREGSTAETSPGGT